MSACDGMSLHGSPRFDGGRGSLSRMFGRTRTAAVKIHVLPNWSHIKLSPNCKRLSDVVIWPFVSDVITGNFAEML